ncbi:hypothetical protein F511_42154 [Dorcoceras hygrometricum]|uniref:IBH1-like N-terminal domain-containing protein n=1 Tax=Dorcoceras hygrometricum TaxID=472368 RepID=A0A2Z7CS11_9LAMI|nr:hypothetical protein F511_42154 [Dorcoceras hygrometricum]
MSSSLLSPNPAVNSDRSLARRKKKKKIQSPAVGENLNNAAFQQQNTPVQWKSDAQHQIYTSKLLQALRQVRQSSASTPQKSASRRVHEAADKVLAATARGRSRWSRAMLVNRLKLKFMKKNITKRQQSVMTGITTGSSRQLKKSKVSILRLKSKSLPAVQRKTRILGRLIPGCRKQPLQVVLEEATDYISALELQVRVMSALADLLSVSGSSSSTSSSDSTSNTGTAGGLTQFRTSQPPTT